MTPLRSTIATIALVIAASAIAALLASFMLAPHAALSLSAIDDCFSNATSTKHAFPSACITATIPRLLQTYSAKQLLAYITATSTPAGVTNVCHPIGHVIGEQTYAKYGSVQQALAQCSSACRSACTHGVIGAGVLDQLGEPYVGEDVAHASESELLGVSARYCSQGSQLCHAIGHVAFIATQDLPVSLDTCDGSATSSMLREACYEGVFMERAGTSINALFPAPDHVLPGTKAGDYTYPCVGLKPQYRLACYIFLNAYQMPLFSHDGLVSSQQKLQKASQVCESLAEPDRSYCFVGIGTSSGVFGAATTVPNSIDAFCAQFPTTSDQNACTLGVIPQFSYDEYRGLYAYCDSQESETQRAFCYDATFEYAQQNMRSTDPQTICNGYQACFPRYSAYEQEKSTLPKYFQESGFQK